MPDESAEYTVCTTAFSRATFAVGSILSVADSSGTIATILSCSLPSSCRTKSLSLSPSPSLEKTDIHFGGERKTHLAVGDDRRMLWWRGQYMANECSLSGIACCCCCWRWCHCCCCHWPSGHLSPLAGASRCKHAARLLCSFSWLPPPMLLLLQLVVEHTVLAKH